MLTTYHCPYLVCVAPEADDVLVGVPPPPGVLTDTEEAGFVVPSPTVMVALPDE